jgi:hypothetical protein
MENVDTTPFVSPNGPHHISSSKTQKSEVKLKGEEKKNKVNHRMRGKKYRTFHERVFNDYLPSNGVKRAFSCREMVSWSDKNT